MLVLVGWGVQDYRRSQVFGTENRYSLVIAGEGINVTFVSFDPTERRVFALEFPAELSIRSRSVGEYQLSTLYKLGSYSGNGGEFVRRKVQGFMRVPVQGYLIVKYSKLKVQRSLVDGLTTLAKRNDNTNLSWLDSATLWYRGNAYTWKEATEDELVRAGVITTEEGKLEYHADRLQQYVGERLFDWSIGSTGVTVAVINESGVDGLGTDVADFLTNLGFDVVAVRTGQKPVQNTTMKVEQSQADGVASTALEALLGLPEPEIGELSEYRADIVVLVGEDAKELF